MMKSLKNGNIKKQKNLKKKANLNKVEATNNSRPAQYDYTPSKKKKSRESMS